MDAQPTNTAEIENEFDQTSQTGWNWFTKFLLFNVLGAIGALLVVGLLTVWS